jgi:putative nucleotidyltransferase with HDIG domain
LFNQFPEGTLNKLRLGSLWDHSMRVGLFARGIAASVTTDRNLIGTASTAGFLHDTGKLIFARHFESEYIKATLLADQEKMHIRDAEKKVIGASHDQLGAYLLGLWGLPEPIVMAAAFHHDVLRYPVQKFNTVSAVHIADAFERQISAGNGGGIAPEIDLSYLDRLGMSNRLEQWRTMCTENNPL